MQYVITVWTNDSWQIKKRHFENESEHWKYSYENKHFHNNQIFTLNNLYGTDMPLNRYKQSEK